MLRKLIIFFIGISWFAMASHAQDGEALFKANCTSCHNPYKKVTGPALFGAVDRWDGEKEEMAAFIKNSTAYMSAGGSKSAYAKQLFEEYNKTVMTAQALSPDEINAVIGYLENLPPPPTEDAAASTASAEVTFSDSELYSSFGALVAILLVACLLVAFGIAVVIHVLRVKEEGKSINWLNWESFQSTLSLIVKSRFFVTIVLLVVIVGGANTAYNFLWKIDLHDGYQPTQPVAFSHKLHAGQYEIDCKYCHIGAERGKSATIPSANICMNCHNLIDKGPKFGETELKKVKEAYENGVPIEWVRIHNLPDFVYFNHSQHVKVAGLECQECHGPVEEMEEVYQYSRLSMGWCIDCHRKKEVNLNQSEYYQETHARLNQDMMEGKLDKITVEKLGGTECARCHY